MNAMVSVNPGSANAVSPLRRSWLGRLLRALLVVAAMLAMLTLVLTVTLSLAAPQAWHELGQNVHLHIDGQSVELGQMGAAHALAVGAALALALTIVIAVVCTVVPLALLVAGGAIAFALGVALLSLFGAAALVLSPLLVLLGLGWLVWRLLRR